MYDDREQIALAALEVVLRGVLDCDTDDKVEIVADVKGEDIEVHGFSISRKDPETGELIKTRFSDIGEIISINGKPLPTGDKLILAASHFLQKVLQPQFRGASHSVRRLIVAGKEIELTERLSAVRSHEMAKKRLYPQA